MPSLYVCVTQNVVVSFLFATLLSEVCGENAPSDVGNDATAKRLTLQQHGVMLRQILNLSLQSSNGPGIEQAGSH